MPPRKFPPFLAACLACIFGCSPIHQPSALVGADPSKATRCETLSDRQMTWGAIAAGGAVVGGSSGFAAVESRDDQALARSLAISGLVVGAIAAGAQYMAHEASVRFVAEGCQ
jgi:hypothetical protein